MDALKEYSKFGIELSQSGDKWRSPCPFHAESSPSFFVYSDLSYHCFGCQAHGTFKDFIEEMGEDSDVFILETADIKQKDPVDLEKYHKKQFTDLYLDLLESDFAIKEKAWKMFDSLWDNVKFMQENSIDFINVFMYIKKKYSKITNLVKI